MFGFDEGRRSYRQPGQDAGTMMVQDPTSNNANTRGGIIGFFANLFSGSSLPSQSSSGYLQSGYLQPAMSPSGDVVLCQPVEGVACQPVTMLPVPGLLAGP